MLAILAVAVILMCVGISRSIVNVTSGIKVFSLIVIIGGALLVVCIGYLEVYKQLEIGKLYPIIALTLGIVFIFLVPAFETPDEQDHFGSAYNLSNTILGYGEPEVESLSPIRYMRAEDAAIADADTIHAIDATAYGKVFDHLGVVNVDGDAKVIATNYSSNAGTLLYILPALGITVARLLHLGFGWAYVLGALLNLLFFVAMTTYAIRKMPFGKRILFVVALLPVMMQQVSSFSYDCGLMACIMVVVAQSFALSCRTSDCHPKHSEGSLIKACKSTIITELIMYIFCAVLISTVKSGVFLAIFLLPIILSIKSSWFKGKNKKIAIVVIVVIIAALAIFMIFLGGYNRIVFVLTTAPENVREIQGMTGLAPIYYITNPGRFFAIIFNTLRENLGHYIAQIGGTALGYNRIFISKFIYIVNLLILLASMIRYDKETDVYKVGNRILTFIVGLVPIMITVLAMLLYWTLPTDNSIMGLQGRYLLPTLPILMMAVGRWRRPFIPNLDNLFAMGMTITGYVTCISVLAFM